uniref:Uncharacterized protein n=1 Tax=Periophthalmus magnuspinnatus TaxID=409849 RepID=A0A3B4B8J9_9GOBI
MWHQFQHSVGIKSCVISRLASRHRTTGRVCERPRSGAPRVTDRNDDLYLRTYALRHRYATVTPLTLRHRRERLQWAQDHVTWTMQQRIHHHPPIPPAHPQLSVHG